jgi:hypothetical protein
MPFFTCQCSREHHDLGAVPVHDYLSFGQTEAYLPYQHDIAEIGVDSAGQPLAYFRMSGVRPITDRLYRQMRNWRS